MELEHFNHAHRLTYSEEKDEVCCGCKKQISGPSYGCAKCSFFLHKRCAELPRKIKHPLHRVHPLTLLMVPSYSSGLACCDLCEKTCDNFIYNCSICEFDIDISCALAPCIVGAPPAGKIEHQFIHLIKSIVFTCDACGVQGTQSPYICVACQLMVHRGCISLPRNIILPGHDHVLTHFHFLQENDESAKLCGLCHKEVEINYGGYYCSVCDYIVHVHCTKPDFTVVEDENLSLNVNGLNGFSLDSNADEDLGTGSEQFRHEHDLVIIDSMVRDNNRCDGCMLPLSAPIYGCLKCDMFLHKKCTELCAKIKHPLHRQHLLSLLSKAPSTDGLFKCDACDQYCHGFCYHCERCNFFIDLRCCEMAENIEHHGHSHPLRLVHGQRNYGCYCGACYCGKFTYFDCTECNFSLDFRCATLPHSVTHRFDESHSLKLTCDAVSNKSIENYCAICELRIDPGLQIYNCVPWFYGCEDCDISIHPECVIGKYPYIKFGGTCTYDDIHPHPLTLIQKPYILVPKRSTLIPKKKKKHYPPCNNCAEPFFTGEEDIGDLLCQDLALQCTLCNFFIHRKDPCFTQQVQQ